MKIASSRNGSRSQAVQQTQRALLLQEVDWSYSLKLERRVVKLEHRYGNIHAEVIRSLKAMPRVAGLTRG